MVGYWTAHLASTCLVTMLYTGLVVSTANKVPVFWDSSRQMQELGGCHQTWLAGKNTLKLDMFPIQMPIDGAFLSHAWWHRRVNPAIYSYDLLLRFYISHYIYLGSPLPFVFGVVCKTPLFWVRLILFGVVSCKKGLLSSKQVLAIYTKHY